MKNIKKMIIMLSLFGCLQMHAMMRRITRMAKMPTVAFYSTQAAQQILKIQPGASQKEIKAAYRKLALKAHPDQGGTNEAFRQVHAAYECLTQPSYFNGSSYSDTTTAQTRKTADQRDQEYRERREQYKQQEEKDRLKEQEEARKKAKAREDQQVEFWHKLYPHKTKEWLREKLRNELDFDQFIREEHARQGREAAERQAAFMLKQQQNEEERKLRYQEEQKEAEERKIKRQETYDQHILQTSNVYITKGWLRSQPTADEVWKAKESVKHYNGDGTVNTSISQATHTYECIDNGKCWKIIFKKK